MAIRPWIRVAVYAMIFASAMIFFRVITPPSTSTPTYADSAPQSRQVIESDNVLVEQSGQWNSITDTSASGGSYLVSASDTDALTLTFTGTYLDIFYAVGPDFGVLTVEIDDTVVRTVVTTGNRLQLGERATFDYLDDGTHTVRVYPASGRVAIDAFVVAQAIATPALPTVTRTGILDLVHGDPQLGSGETYRYVVYLTDPQTMTETRLLLPLQDAQRYTGKTVTVTAQVSRGPLTPDSRLRVESIAPAASSGFGPQSGDTTQPLISGAQPWVNLFCKFAGDNDEPRPLADYANLFGNTYPNLDHYWRQISYNTINIAGTYNIPQWVILPNPRTAYLNSNGDLLTGTLRNDCVAAADSLVYFPSFVGINMFFNDNLDCCAWGGQATLALDGQFKTYRTTWLPPWADAGTIAHEMGHGFGWPHSTGPHDNSPDTVFNIYISQWDVMSASSGNCSASGSFGCLPPGTISDQLTRSEWIPTDRIVTVEGGQSVTATLERLNQPLSPTNPLMVKIPINGSTTEFYTVEARFRVTSSQLYDQNIPASAVIINHVIRGRQTENGGDARIVDADDGNDNVNDAGARWLPGETFTDTVNDITIEVLSQGASSFTVRVTNNSIPDLTVRKFNSPGATYLRNPSFSWDKSSPTASYYRLVVWDQFGNTYYNVWNLTTAICGLTTCTLRPEISLPADTVIYWTVGAYSSTQGEGPLGATQVFVVGSPYRTAPTNNAVVTNADGKPTYQWEPTRLGETYYQLYIADSAGTVFTRWYSTAEANCTQTSCSIKLNGYENVLYEDKSYAWYIRGWGPQGYGPWSAPYPYTINVAPPPLPSGLVATINHGDIKFQWTDHPNAAWFGVVVTDAANTTQYLNQWYQKGNSALNCNGTTCTLVPNLYLANGSYKWYVAAYGASGQSTGGISGYREATLNINLSPTNPPTIGLSPKDITFGDTYTQSWQTYSWKAVSAAWYELYIADTAGVMVHQQWYRASDVCSGVTCSVARQDYQHSVNGTYTWWVRAWNSAGNSVGGPVNNGWNGPHAYTYATTITAAPTQSAPKNTITTGHPTYTWTLNSGSAMWYELYIARADSGEVMHQQWYQTGNCPTKPCIRSVTPQIELLDGNYVWYVRGWNQAGYTTGGPNNSGWAGAMNFTVDSNAPGTATLVAPSNGAIVANTKAVTFQWNAATNAVWHQLNVTRGTWTYNTWHPCYTAVCSVTITVPYGDYISWNVIAWTSGGQTGGGEPGGSDRGNGFTLLE